MPKVWKNINLLNILLLPFCVIYYLFYLLNYYIIQRPKAVNAKVICIGNIVAGGSGKTPYAIYFAKKITSTSKGTDAKIAFILRGYKGSASSSKTVHRVLGSDTSKLVGDEALLLAQIAPTYICKNRYLAAKSAVTDGANIIIMDDGMQNNTLKQNEVILVCDSYSGFGNGLLLPAGPMREPYIFCKNRINKVVIIGNGSCNISHPNVERMIPQITNIEEIFGATGLEVLEGTSRKCVLLTAIANAQRVVRLLSDAGVDIIEHTELPDHYHFSVTLLKDMERYAKEGTIVVTTEKDFVRIPKEYHKVFKVLKYSLKIV